MSVKIQVRRDTASNWSTHNPVLSSGEIGLDQTNNYFKVGDGSTAWSSLPQFTQNIENVEDLVGAMVDGNTESGIAVTYDDETGKLNFNVDDPNLTISGDATASVTMTDLGNTDLPLTLADTAVTAGSYGSASLIPIITVDSKGRLTSASTSAVAGVTDFDYNTSTGVLDIDTADGANYSTTVTLGPFTTSTLTEGSNLYYLDSRAISAIEGEPTLNLSGVPTAPTATSNTNTTQVATTAYVQTEITELIGGAPGALDTLNELAAAINDDASYASTITTSLGTKEPNITSGTTAEYWRGDKTFQTLDTVAVAEGTNLYWTTARGQSMFDTRLGTKDTADLTEGSNLYHTTERVQDIAASMFSSGTQSGISVTYDDTNGTLSLNVGDPTLTISGDGTATSTMTDLGNTTLSLTLSDTAVSAGSYGSASLVPIITVDSKGRVTAASTTSVAGVTDFDYNTSTGVLDIDTADGNNFDTTVTLGPFTTSTLTEGSNLYFTDARVITSLASVSGHIIPDTDVTYDLGSSTYKFRDLYLSGSSIKLGSATITASGTTVVLPVGSKISGGGVLLDLTTHDTDDLSEGSTNLYYLDSRARGSVSVTDSGGDGSLAYNSSTGVITYTGPSASEVRAHLSAGTGVGVSSGVISIGQAVGTTDDVTFDDVVISGNLTVSGTTTTIDTNTLNIGDNIITLNSDEAGTPSQNAGIEVERGTSTNKTFIWDEANDRWTVGSETMVAATFIGDVTGTTSDISNHSTSDLSEGTNLYYLDSRARAAISVTDSGGDGSLAYNSTTGVITYVGPSSSEVRAHLSSTDTAGHGAFSYNSSTGVFSHTRVTSAEVRGDISVATSGDGSLAYASGTGIITYVGPSASEHRAHFSAATSGTGHGGLTYDDGVYTYAKVTAGDVRGDISVTDSGGDGSLAYNSTSGVITYVGPSASEVRAHISASGDLSYSAGVVSFTERTDAEVRGLVSVTDSGGDGSLAYNSSTGVITYTGPSSAEVRAHISVTDSGGDGSLTYSSGVITYTGPSSSEVRAHLSAGTGVSYSGGQFSIGQAVGTTDDVTFDDVVISGNLTVSGTTTTIDTTTLNIGDNIITLNNDETGTPSQNSGIEIERGTSTNKTFVWDEGNDKWTVGSETIVASTFEGQISTLSNHDTADLAEGTNLYYLDSRARSAISIATSGDGSISYASGTGVITYAGPSASEHRAHFSATTSGTGHGGLTYADGVYTYAKVTAGDVRGDISVTDSGGDGSLSYVAATGVITYTGPTASEVRAHISASGDLAYSAGVVSFTERTDAEVRGLVSVTDSGGDGSLGYVAATGVITYTGPSASETRAHFSAATSGTGHGGLNYTDGVYTYAKVTSANIRGDISAATSGDGSISYSSGTGVITYVGPSASEHRAHFSGGTGVGVSSGVISIGQDVSTTSDVTFDDVVISGNLTVSGTTTTVNTTEINIADNIITLNSDVTGTPTQNSGFEIERGTSSNVSMLWDEANDRWTLGAYDLVASSLIGDVTGDVSGTVSSISNHSTSDLSEGSNLYWTTSRGQSMFDTRLGNKDTADLSEGTNLYYTDARARAAISENSTQLSYVSGTGVLTFTQGNTDTVSEGSSNLYYTNTRADARITAALIDEDNMATNSATRLPSQQSVKAYVDSQVTAQDLDFVADTGGALSIDLDSESMTFTGGTGIDTTGAGNVVTFAIDTTVSTLSGSQTLTNKILTSAVLNGTISGTSIKDQDDMSSDSNTHLATQQSIKAYVDAQIGAENTLAEDNDVNITSAADGSMLLYDNGTSKWRDAAMSGDASINDTGVLTLASIADGKLTEDYIKTSEVDGSSIEFTNASLNVKASGITNAMLSGSIANGKLTNSSVTVTAGAGLSDGGSVSLGSSTTLNVAVDDSSIEINSDSLRIKSTWTGQSSITTTGTISTGTWSATDVAVSHGGTGSSTASGARSNLGLGSSDSPTFNGITHSGLTMTDGTDIDQLKTYTKSLNLSTTSWFDTGINATELSTGSYMVQVLVDNNDVGGGSYSELYTGMMSWYAGNPNSTVTDEIVLHRAGHAPTTAVITLRTERVSSSDTNDMMLQIATTDPTTGADNYIFKFRRLI